ncbi:MAG: hypothetical protein BTN85_1841 [Candidatus Methanohalarchaeum thermophilum]|uniref:Uncharacterized protein n=1 Tax=Methanohalarchaeum thermophilum TaxID=1903181 RepID=A0A1Q6DS47_METT1|nr:MAG: hypothetical protein BTN85_1841 [Candidatus Methanohalarchaeum thermophilum]
MIGYVGFVLFFVFFHVVSYFVAGMIAYSISKNLYVGSDRLLDFLVSPEEEGETGFTVRRVLPAQLVRGLLMSVLLIPLIGTIADFSLGIRFLFFAGLMFIYTDLSSAAPFPSNIEGFVYMKKKYVKKEVFWKTQVEMVVYSLVFGVLISLSI